ncbi:MAG TPA: ABC transporter permease [Holophagaceae bacterium]|nr:ABC transporter permease [Holophagaceae bacterium]
MKRSAAALARAAATLLGVWLVVQLLPRWLPEDPARIAAGEWATEADVAALRHAMALDRSWYSALAASARGWLHADPGLSLRYHRPVSAVLRGGFPVSLRLALLALLVSALLGWALALWRGRAARLAEAAAIASPVYVLGPLLLWAVAQHASWIPVSGTEGWAAWILPTLSLAVPLAGHQARVLRPLMAAHRGAAGIRWWEALAVPRRRRWLRWALPSAAGPWLTVLGLQLGALLGGAVLAESIFGLPGLGSLLVGALSARDLPLVQATVLLGAALYIATQLLVEWTQGLLDPRLR